MDQLKAMRVFARVIDEGSFAGAARALDLAPAVVTRLVAELEEHLGARLLNRTTRRLALTEVGEAYLERCRRVLMELEDAQALVQSATHEARGHVRVLVPPAIAVHQLAKHLARFHQQYPHVTIELHSPGPVTQIDEAFDISILSTKEPLQGDFVARRLARTEVILCAAPEFLQRRGRPQHPQELPQFDVLVPPMAIQQRGIVFMRRGQDGAPDERIEGECRRGVLTTGHNDTNYAAALHGLGIAALPSFMIEDALMEHALERVLPQWRMQSYDIWAAMPSRKFVPARTRVFLDFLVSIFGGQDHDPWLEAAGCATR